MPEMDDDDELPEELDDEWAYYYGDDNSGTPQECVTDEKQYLADKEFMTLHLQAHRNLAKWFGGLRGYAGGPGGWVYDRKDKVVSHGWLDLYDRRKRSIWNKFWAL
jgi:hypothetical protein